MSVDYGDRTFLFQCCTTSFDWATWVADRDLIGLRIDESRLIHILSKKVKIAGAKNRTHAHRTQLRALSCLRQQTWSTDSINFFKGKTILCKTILCTNDDRIVKTDKKNNFRPKLIYDLLSYFQFQTDLFFVLSKNNRSFFFS